MEIETKDEMENPENHNPKNRGRIFLIALAVILIVGGAFRIGYITGNKGYVFNPKEFKIINQGEQPKNVDYGLLWKALDIINKKYIDSSQVDQQKILYGAIRGAVAAVGDDYTQFFDEKTLSDFRTELQGSFSGIGAEIAKKDGNLIVVAPIKDSPSDKAGVLPQDIIVKINGEDVADLSVDEAVNRIRGPEGSQVTLSVFREGKEGIFDIKITRQKIEIKSVKVDYKTVGNKKIAVISISRFGDDTKQLFLNAVNDINSKGVSGIVVDLRNNPGGYLESAVDLASQWLEEGKLVVKEEHSEKDAIVYNSTGGNQLGKYKTIILINGGSASAAEILAGALKDNGKASLIGEKSFGKGSVQELVPLTDSTAIKVTIAKWITPGGKNLNKDGLNPDIEVKLSDDDLKNQKDPQMDKALEEAAK